jgi:hypothetical protein
LRRRREKATDPGWCDGRTPGDRPALLLASETDGQRRHGDGGGANSIDVANEDERFRSANGAEGRERILRN